MAEQDVLDAIQDVRDDVAALQEKVVELEFKNIRTCGYCGGSGATAQGAGTCDVCGGDGIRIMGSLEQP